jgi:hypothetical protein
MVLTGIGLFCVERQVNRLAVGLCVRLSAGISGQRPLAKGDLNGGSWREPNVAHIPQTGQRDLSGIAGEV